jgi:hypothetical protein
MKDSKPCDIEDIVKGLHQTIEQKKTKLQEEQEAYASSVLPHISSAIASKTGGFYTYMNAFLEQGGEYAREVLEKFQVSVRERPWESLRKVAIYSFAVGLFLSVRHRQSKEQE